jgi:hypothetical protein
MKVRSFLPYRPEVASAPFFLRRETQRTTENHGEYEAQVLPLYPTPTACGSKRGDACPPLGGGGLAGSESGGGFSVQNMLIKRKT